MKKEEKLKREGYIWGGLFGMNYRDTLRTLKKLLTPLGLKLSLFNGYGERGDESFAKIVPIDSAQSLVTPPVSVAIKLASIAVHVDEMLSPSGHTFDLDVLKSLLKDGEVQAYLKELDKLALLPVKR